MDTSLSKTRAALAFLSFLLVCVLLLLPGGLLSFFISAGIMLAVGNSCPKLPFNRYIGLRLPWTVTDEEAWIVAHRLIGYLTLPIVLVIVAGMLLLRGAYALGKLITGAVLFWVIVPSVLSGIFYWKKFHRTP